MKTTTSQARHYPIYIEHEGQTAFLEFVNGELVYGGTMAVDAAARAFFDALKPHFEEYFKSYKQAIEGKENI